MPFSPTEEHAAQQLEHVSLPSHGEARTKLLYAAPIRNPRVLRAWHAGHASLQGPYRRLKGHLPLSDCSACCRRVIAMAVPPSCTPASSFSG